MNLQEWVSSIFVNDFSPFVNTVLLGIVWLIVYDFYHLLFASVFSWFKKS